MTPTEPPVSNFPLAIEPVSHYYGTGEKLPIRMPKFRPSGNPLEAYRLASGFYSTGDSSAWTLSTEQFREFLEFQAMSQNLLSGLLQMFTTQKAFSSYEEKSRATQRLLSQILELRNTIEKQKGTLSESYPLIREDRER